MSVQAGVEGTGTQGQNNGTGSQGQETQQGNQQEQNQQQNTAPYAPFLERIPESLRPSVEPIFKEWDAGVNNRFQQLHSQYDWAKPWQEIAQTYEPDVVSQAINVLSALEQNPQGFYEALAQAYGFNGQQAQQVVEQGLQEQQQVQENSDPRYTQLEETVGTIAQMMLDRQQQEQFQQEEQQLRQELQALQTKYGDFDEDYVVTKIAAGMEPEEAVTSYRALVGQQAQQLNAPGQEAPVVMSSGGGVPSQNVDLVNLDRKGTQSLIANVLAANRAQGG